jgi:hypothetical protein
VFGRLLRTSNPVSGTTPYVHDSEDANLGFGQGVENAVWKTLTQSPANLPANDRARFGVLDDGTCASANLIEERETETGLLVFEVLDGVVEFAFGQLVEGDPHA